MVVKTMSNNKIKILATSSKYSNMRVLGTFTIIRMHTHMHAHTHTHACTCTHTHKHAYVIKQIINCPLFMSVY